MSPKNINLFLSVLEHITFKSRLARVCEITPYVKLFEARFEVAIGCLALVHSNLQSLPDLLFRLKLLIDLTCQLKVHATCKP